MEALIGIIENALPFLESAGIIGGLFFTGWSLWMDTRVRRVQNLLTLTAHHREIWSEVYRNPLLKRVINPNANLKKEPITIQERLFTRSIFLHLSASFHASKTGMFSEPEGLRRDIKSFLRLPIPKQVWNQSRGNHNQEFTHFIEEQIESKISSGNNFLNKNQQLRSSHHRST